LLSAGRRFFHRRRALTGSTAIPSAGIERAVSCDTVNIPEHKNVIVVLSSEQIPASRNAEA
jgi:hypothetical protein